MAKVTAAEPQSAADYDDRTTAAVKSVLIEIAQVLGSFKGKFAVIGGAVPWLLLDGKDMPHVGTLDVDLALHAESLGDGEYATLIESLMAHGYEQRNGLRRFQLVRRVEPADGGAKIDIIVDFLMPRDAKFVKNKPPLIDDFAVQRAEGAELALSFPKLIAISGAMPDGGKNKVEIAVCSIPALLAMKGFAVHGRDKRKDAYDVYYCVRNYPGGVEALAEDCCPILAHPSGEQGYRYIAEKFDTVDSFGPTRVRQFVERSKLLEDRTPEQWQQDAFGQVNAWLQELGLVPGKVRIEEEKPGKHRKSKLDTHEEHVRQLIEACPEITLEEVQEALVRDDHLEASLPTIRRFLESRRISLQKNRRLKKKAIPGQGDFLEALKM